MSADRFESVTLPEIGALVRSKALSFRSRPGTSGRVKAVLSQDNGTTVVIESIWGAEMTVSAGEYSSLFEECGPRDIAREYWESS
jgi:hypothetical protein